jgi:hypothetical protein
MYVYHHLPKKIYVVHVPEIFPANPLPFVLQAKIWVGLWIGYTDISSLT